MKPLSDPFKLGDWIVYPSLHRLSHTSRKSEAVGVQPRVMGVLVYLAANEGRVVTREELLDKVWAEVTVGEEALTRAMSELRRTLGDDPAQPRLIETIRKGGYRLLQPVEALPAEAGAGKGEESTEAIQRRVLLRAVAAIAVLVLLGATWWMSQRNSEEADSQPAAPLTSVPLTSYEGSERFPALSPDGTMVAFSWDGPQRDNLDVYVKQIGEDQPLRLTEHPGWDAYPRWTPDGQALVFIHGDPGGTGVFRVPLLGGEMQPLLKARHVVEGMAFLDEGRTLVYGDREEAEGPTRLYARDLESAAERIFVDPEPERADTMPLASPDGSQVAFFRSGKAKARATLMLVPASGGAPRQLGEPFGKVEGATWDSAGRSLVVSTREGNNFALWRIDAETGTRTWVPVHGEWLYFPSVSPGAERLVYEHRWFDKNIWEVDAESGEAKRLIVSSRWDCEGHLSPDDSKIAFNSTRSGNLEIWMSKADGSSPVQLTRFGGPAVGSPSWSPDGSQIVFVAEPEGFSDLYVLDAATRRMTRLTSGQGHHLAPSWSADGRWIYFGSERSGDWNVWKLDAQAGGEAIQVTREGGVRAVESSDGAFVYFTRQDQAGLWRVSAADPGASEEISASLPHRGEWNNWALWSDGAVALDYVEGDAWITALDLETGATHAIAAAGGVAMPSLTVSADGTRILYARIEHSVSDLVLVEGFR